MAVYQTVPAMVVPPVDVGSSRNTRIASDLIAGSLRLRKKKNHVIIVRSGRTLCGTVTRDSTWKRQRHRLRFSPMVWYIHCDAVVTVKAFVTASNVLSQSFLHYHTIDS